MAHKKCLDAPVLTAAWKKAHSNLAPKPPAPTEPRLTHQRNEVCHGLVHRAPVHARVQVSVTAFHLDGNKGHSVWLLSGSLLSSCDSKLNKEHTQDLTGNY